MSMHPDSQNFDELRRLLAVKRHEQPPPGYFHDFSGQVIARLRAGESGEPAAQHWWDAPWLHRLWSALEAKPIMAGAMGVAACVMLLAGVVFTEVPEKAPEGYPSTAATATVDFAEHASSSFLNPQSLVDFQMSTGSASAPAQQGSLFGMPAIYTVPR